MRPRRIDTIDIITPTVMRVGRNSVVGRVASGQNRPKERASGSSQLNRNAPNPPHRRAVNADRNHQLNYELPNAASIVSRIRRRRRNSHSPADPRLRSIRLQ